MSENTKHMQDKIKLRLPIFIEYKYDNQVININKIIIKTELKD